MEYTTFYFRKERDYQNTRALLSEHDLNPFMDFEPHLMQFDFDPQKRGIILSGAEEISHPIPESTLESMAKYEIRLTAQAWVTPIEKKENSNEGLPWDSPRYEEP